MSPDSTHQVLVSHEEATAILARRPKQMRGSGPSEPGSPEYVTTLRPGWNKGVHHAALGASSDKPQKKRGKSKTKPEVDQTRKNTRAFSTYNHLASRGKHSDTLKWETGLRDFC